MRLNMKLSDAVRAEGYGLVVGPVEWCEENGFAPVSGELIPLGEPNGPVIVCERTTSKRHEFVIIVPDDSWDYAYSAAHEIAEHRDGFEHSELMWSEQANLLARWCKLLATRLQTTRLLVTP
jgi:hypothetical protein